jgi:hypothetical protein
MTIDDIADKLASIHDEVVNIRADLRADKRICETMHQQVDDKIHALHKVVKGNGTKGLEDKHNDLSAQFLRFKYYVLGYCAGGAFIGGVAFTAITAYWK